MIKKLHLKSLLLIAALLVGSSSAWAQTQVTIWSENFDDLDEGATPTAATNTDYSGVTYTCTNGAGTSSGETKVMNAKLAGGASAPELMVGKKGTGTGAAGGKFTAVIPLDNIEGTLTLTYYQNKQSLKVSSTTNGVSGGQTLKPSDAGQQTTTFTGITSSMTSITIVFEATTTNNVRLDDIVLKGYNAIPINSIAFSEPKTASVVVGGTVTLTPTVLPANHSEAVDWESDATGIATVSSTGVVTGVSAGTAHIKAKSHGNNTIYDVCTVTVTAPIAVTGVSLNESSLNMYMGDTETLVATIAPSNATNKAVTWASDKTSVATVSSDGVVTAVGVGTCKITVTTDDGSKTATCDVAVTPRPINLSAPIVISDWSDVSSSYYTSESYLNIEGYTFKVLQCCKQTYLQVKASAGVLTSPTINSPNGFTVIVETATGSNNSGVLTLQIGNETAVTATGPNKTMSASTTATSTSFTIKNLSSNVMKVGKITIVPNQYSTTVQSYGWASFIAPAPVQFAPTPLMW